MLWQYFSSYIWDQNNTDETSNHRMNVSWAEEDDWVLVVKKENKGRRRLNFIIFFGNALL